MATLTERFAALNRAEAEDGSRWGIANNGTGPRIWFIRRHTDTPWYDYHTNKDGALLRYTFAGALAKAEELNGK